MNEAYRDLTFEELLMVNGGKAQHSRKPVSAGGQNSQTQNSDNDKNDSHTVVRGDTLTKIVKEKNPDLKGDALAKEVDRVAAQNNLKDKNIIRVGEKLDLGKGNSREDKTKERSTYTPNRNSGKTKTEERSSKIVKESNREDKTEESFPRTSSEGKEKRSEAGSLTTTNKSNSNDINKTKQAAASANDKPEPTKNNLLGALTNGLTTYIGSGWKKFKDNVSKAWDNVRNDLATLKNNIGNGLSNAADTVKNGLANVFNPPKNNLGNTASDTIHIVQKGETVAGIVSRANPNLKGSALTQEINRVLVTNDIKDPTKVPIGQKLNLGSAISDSSVRENIPKGKNWSEKLVDTIGGIFGGNKETSKPEDTRAMGTAYDLNNFESMQIPGITAPFLKNYAENIPLTDDTVITMDNPLCQKAFDQYFGFGPNDEWKAKNIDSVTCKTVTLINSYAGLVDIPMQPIKDTVSEWKEKKLVYADGSPKPNCLSKISQILAGRLGLVEYITPIYTDSWGTELRMSYHAFKASEYVIGILKINSPHFQAVFKQNSNKEPYILLDSYPSSIRKPFDSIAPMKILQLPPKIDKGV